MDEDFWAALDKLVQENRVVIDRPKGSRHPKFDFVYPLDYGYLDGTRSGDGNGIDVWLGSLPEREITGIVVTVDRLKKDSEIKILLGCTLDEQRVVYEQHHNQYMDVMVIRRGEGKK